MKQVLISEALLLRTIEALDAPGLSRANESIRYNRAVIKADQELRGLLKIVPVCRSCGAGLGSLHVTGCGSGRGGQVVGAISTDATQEPEPAQAVDPEPFESTGDFEADIANLESAIYDNTHNVLPRGVLEFLVKLHPHPAPAKPLSDEQAHKLCKEGGAVHCDAIGRVVLYPQQYRDQLTAARIAGLRIGEAAHGIVGQS